MTALLNVISFGLNSVVEQYKIIAKLGTFLLATRYFCVISVNSKSVKLFFSFTYFFGQFLLP